MINPVAMTWDERGRLWVLELYEYPLGAPKGQRGRDRIKILEDTDGDGRADKVTVFADGFSLATGLALGNGGVYVGQAPDFYFIPRLDGDKAGERQTLLTGFGMQDRHELLNSFTWGPDGWLYMTHGVFTYSKVRDPANPDAPAVEMNAAVARYQPRTKKFEVFAEGTSNPWGIDFDRAGNAFVSACVIDHLFHIVQGGVYVRQAGAPSNPYTYELLPSIVKHKHQMAAYAGVCVYQGDNFPAEYRGTVFMGNIHGNCINHDRLVPNGSSFIAEKLPDFLSAHDGWFRPVSEQVGPDGALWIMDWYDKYPCYQNANADPAGIDRERGRIWRVVYTGKNAGKKIPLRPDNKMDLSKLSTDKLVALLASENIWQRRMAQHLLSERHDDFAYTRLKKLLFNGKNLETRLAALWTLYTSDQINEANLEKLLDDKEPAIRGWVATIDSELNRESNAPLLIKDFGGRDLHDDGIISYKDGRTEFSGAGSRRIHLAQDPDSSVRLRAAAALVVFPDTLANCFLMSRANDVKDTLLPFMIWRASESNALDFKNGNLLNWIKNAGAEHKPLSNQILRKSTHRLADSGKSELLNEVVDFLQEVKDDSLAVAAMDGLLDAKSKTKPSAPASDLLAKLIASPNAEVSDRAKRLAVLWGDTKIAEGLLAQLNDPKSSDAARREAIAVAREIKTDKAREALLAALDSERQRDEIIRALGEVGGDSVAAEILKRWKDFSPEARRVAIEVLASRPAWAKELLQSVGQVSNLPNQEIAQVANLRHSPALSDLHPSVVRTLARYEDKTIRELFAKTIGRFRETSADKSKLIADKKKIVLAGAVDFNAGRELTRKTCLVCHALNGEGANVGPDLTGSGRASLDALLTNVIDPNQIIGKGYEQVEVTTKDDRSVSGRVIADTPTHVTLLSAGPKEETIARADIAKLRVSELSVMPEGLEQMPDADFRNLIWFVLLAPKEDLPATTAAELARQYTRLLNP